MNNNKIKINYFKNWKFKNKLINNYKNNQRN